MDRQAEREAGRQADRQAGRRTGRQVGGQERLHLNLRFLSGSYLTLCDFDTKVKTQKYPQHHRTYKSRQGSRERSTNHFASQHQKTWPPTAHVPRSSLCHSRALFPEKVTSLSRMVLPSAYIAPPLPHSALFPTKDECAICSTGPPTGSLPTLMAPPLPLAVLLTKEQNTNTSGVPAVGELARALRGRDQSVAGREEACGH